MQRDIKQLFENCIISQVRESMPAVFRALISESGDIPLSGLEALHLICTKVIDGTLSSEAFNVLASVYQQQLLLGQVKPEEQRRFEQSMAFVVSGFEDKHQAEIFSTFNHPCAHDINSMVTGFKATESKIWNTCNHKPVARPVKTMTVIVHGTNARKEKWWQQGGDFWNYIDSKVTDLYQGAHAFLWSGHLGRKNRVYAAAQLKTWVNNHAKAIDIIAHSHGGNVAIEASRMGLKIRKLTLLGTPIRFDHVPDMRNIDQIVNVYSSGDNIQTLGATFRSRGDSRTLSDSVNVLNLYADNNGYGMDPSHKDLHDRQTWIDSTGLEDTLKI